MDAKLLNFEWNFEILPNVHIKFFKFFNNFVKKLFQRGSQKSIFLCNGTKIQNLSHFLPDFELPLGKCTLSIKGFEFWEQLDICTLK